MDITMMMPGSVVVDGGRSSASLSRWRPGQPSISGWSRGCYGSGFSFRTSL
uniref:Uncharacterized protein n=1 Tax=Arundo donax TaxID=35708 RepID=A0A0A9GP12_ARUDO